MSNAKYNKRFILFGGNKYYPLGGWDDMFNQYDTLSDALAAAKEESRKRRYQFEWWHIYDRELNEIVADHGKIF